MSSINRRSLLLMYSNLAGSGSTGGKQRIRHRFQYSISRTREA